MPDALTKLAEGERLLAEWHASIDADDHQRILTAYSRAAFWLLTNAHALLAGMRALVEIVSDEKRSEDENMSLLRAAQEAVARFTEE